MSNIFKTLATADRRIWHLCTFLIVSILLLNPLGLPLAVGEEVIKTYGIVNNLKPGDIVLINYDIAAYGWDELKGQCLSVVPHIMEKPGVKVLFMTNMDQGIIFIEQTFQTMGKLMPGKTGAPWYVLNDKKYLEDWVILGYFPGQETPFAALAADFRKNAGDKDWYGNQIGGWLNQIGLNSAKDIDLLVSFDCTSGASWFARHFYLPNGTPIIAGEIGVNVPTSLTNYNAGLYKGLIKSTRGAAEYQFLSGYRGKALVSMDAYSAIHIFLILIAVVGNIGYFGWERKAMEVKK